VYTARYTTAVKAPHFFREKSRPAASHAQARRGIDQAAAEGYGSTGKRNQDMNTKATIGEIIVEQGSRNVYADLGFPDADEMLVKAKLASEIRQIIKSWNLTQQRAAEMLGMREPKLAEMLRGNFSGISQTKMIECLNRLGRDVEIVVKQAGRRNVGHTQVVVV
jgi:predicted XRE-type DNA-binding protein